LGVEVVVPRGGNAPASDAPGRLRAHIGEVYYPQLGARSARAAMTPAMNEKLAGYVELRDKFLGELRDHVHGIHEADTETRMRMNAELARVQTPALLALEETADRIRFELYRSPGLGRDEFDWNNAREWKLGGGALKRPREENALQEYQVIRAAAYFQDGLVPAQRRLLLEVAMEMEDRIFRADSQPMREFGFVFFSPETSRVRIPAGLPQEALARLEGYEREKSALKTEIADLVYAVDARLFVSTRARDLADLAQRQSARLESLEELAEDVRVALVDVPALRRPTPPRAVPESIDILLREYQRDREALQRRLVAAVRAAQVAVPPAATQEPAELAEHRERLAAAVETATRTFEQENVGEYEALQSDMNALIEAVSRFIPEDDEVLLQASPEAIITAFLARQRREEAAFEYHTAVLEPALSPPQRRLLFAGAQRRMALPLPGGEPYPAALPGTLIPLEELRK
jgi:hypothetical protein